MNNLWLKIGCFLTGYNYTIVKSSSEASAKTVKKYLSAILIVCIIWGFIGYSFAERYLGTDIITSSIVAFVMVVIVIHIERQIILSMGKNWLIPFFRILIGIVMAMIGSIIIDQIIFKEDVEKQKISNIQEEVNTILTSKTKELDNQVMQIDSAINLKEAERAIIIDELSRKPFVRSARSEIRHHKLTLNGQDSIARDTIVRKTDYILTDVPNPKGNLLPEIEKQIAQLQAQKSEKENRKINFRQELEDELKSKTGFLDELKVLIFILLSSPVALLVWILFFIFFLSIELFVLVNKFGEKGNDYDRVINHQVNTRIAMLEKLAAN